MEYIINNTYKIRDSSKNNLLPLGFRYNTYYSNSDADCYTLRFPVHKYNGTTILECELIIGANSSGNVTINVFDKNTKSTYKPFYNFAYGNYKPIIKTINKSILTQFKKLGIEKENKAHEK